MYPDRRQHARSLGRQATASLASVQERRLLPERFDPKLILRFRLHYPVSEDEWRRAGLAVLDSSERDVAVVFSADAELAAFRTRLEEYAVGVRPDRQTAAFEGFFDAIAEFSPLGPEDRVSTRLSELLTDNPAEARAMDVEFWFVEDDELRGAWLEEARTATLAAGGQWLDTLVLPATGVFLARVAGGQGVAQALAELDQVVLVDAVPDPRLTQVELADFQHVEQIDEVLSPDAEAPVVGVVDSGVQSGHPLIADALVEATALHPEFGGQAEDTHGHGTLVCGRVLYGDVLEAARNGSFEAHFWLASVRVLGDDNLFPENVNWVTAVVQAIRYLAEDWECRVVNLSIGDADSPYAGGHSTALAAALDGLAREYGLVVIVAAGNHDPSELVPLREQLRGYPQFLGRSGTELIDPAQAASALTVGALAEADGVSPRPFSQNLGVGAVAAAYGPAPYTRCGPGVGRALKPELVSDGGNLVFDDLTGTFLRDPAVEVFSTINRFPDRLFATFRGTSFAAPQVTHVAGRLASEYPAIRDTTIRALLLQGAHQRQVTIDVLGADEDRLLTLCGAGGVDWERCGESREDRVVLYAEDAMRPDDFHVYRLPLPPQFHDVSGYHSVTVALAFTPPVRHRRLDYMAHTMEFLLVRGASSEDVFEMAGADVDDPDAGRLSGYEAAMRPPRTRRSRGCNQVARFELHQRPREQFRDDWYIVVRSLNRWMSSHIPPERYSLAVALQVDRATDLYAELQAEMQVELEVQV